MHAIYKHICTYMHTQCLALHARDDSACIFVGVVVDLTYILAS